MRSPAEALVYCLITKPFGMIRCVAGGGNSDISRFRIGEYDKNPVIELIKFSSVCVPEVAHGENKTQVSVIFSEQVILSSSLNAILKNHQKR
jgi:hypothetical protein